MNYHKLKAAVESWSQRGIISSAQGEKILALYEHDVPVYKTMRFWLMSLGLTCGPLWRRRWLLIGIVAGGVVGLGRMLQGGHFFSDILFAFFTVWLSCEIVAWLDKRRRSRHT